MNTVLITGGTGSFGQAYVERALSRDYWDRIVVYSRGEHLQEEMARRFNDERMRFFIGDVRDLPRLEMAMRGVDTVIHAAALKIVPTCEYNPFEAINTNILGAQNVVRAAINEGVEQVIALSTDKACHPINLYGATKLAAEKLFIASNTLAAGKTTFSVVRYGNVVRSRGSVIPFFEKLIKEGVNKLPITHPDMTRFWITLAEAVDMVETVRIINHGAVYIPRIPSFKVVDLVQAMGKDYEIIGIRPGEKLHETLITADEAPTAASIYGGSYWALYPNHRAKMPFASYSSDKNDFLTVGQLKERLTWNVISS
jgi:UDP-N-acetylglucosamine 4,6-dehydratase